MMHQNMMMPMQQNPTMMQNPNMQQNTMMQQQASIERSREQNMSRKKPAKKLKFSIGEEVLYLSPAKKKTGRKNSKAGWKRGYVMKLNPLKIKGKTNWTSQKYKQVKKIRKEEEEEGDEELDVEEDSFVSQDDNDAREMCNPDVTEEDLQANWLFQYFMKWDSYPITEMNQSHDSTYDQLMEKMYEACQIGVDAKVNKNSKNEINVVELAEAFGIKDEDPEFEEEGWEYEEYEEKCKLFVCKCIEKGFKKGMKKALNRMIAEGISESVTGGVRSKAGRRGAIIMTKQSMKYVGGKAGMRAFKALSSPGVGLAAVVGEMAGLLVCHYFGIEDQRIITCCAAAGTILACAAVGACGGGPVGAAAGAAVGSTFVAMSETTNAVMRVGWGPEDNWCYIETGSLNDFQICASTYAGDDGVMWKSYGNWYYGEDKMDYFCAGQQQHEYFQVAFFNENGVKVKHFPRVYYRDTFFVSKAEDEEGGLVIVFARGGFNTGQPGQVTKDTFDAEGRIVADKSTKSPVEGFE